MIFRLSLKLAKKTHVSGLADLPLDENPYVDWSCHLFTANRTQYLIFCNTRSLYSCVTLGRGIADDRSFTGCALGAIREFLESDGQASVHGKSIAPQTNSIRFAKALNRSVTGSINDLVQGARWHLTAEGVSPLEASLRINETPLSVLGFSNPREAFRALASDRMAE